MKYDRIEMDEAKGKYGWLWKAFKANFPNSKHEDIRKMVEVGIAITKGYVRNEELDEELDEEPFEFDYRKRVVGDKEKETCDQCKIVFIVSEGHEHEEQEVLNELKSEILEKTSRQLFYDLMQEEENEI